MRACAKPWQLCCPNHIEYRGYRRSRENRADLVLSAENIVTYVRSAGRIASKIACPRVDRNKVFITAQQKPPMQLLRKRTHMSNSVLVMVVLYDVLYVECGTPRAPHFLAPASTLLFLLYIGCLTPLILIADPRRTGRDARGE